MHDTITAQDSAGTTYTLNPTTGTITYTISDTSVTADEWVTVGSLEEVMPRLLQISQIHDPDLTLADLSENALSDPAVLRELVYNAYAMIQAQIYDEDTGKREWKDTSVATNVGLRERTDQEDLSKAEAAYEAALRRIDKKEQQYDKELAKFDQERKALTSQLDTLKTCIKENIDRTFKIFQG